MIRVLVIGGGMAGCCASHLLADKGYDVTLIEKEAYLGGGCKTFFYGGHPYTYGPRHFLTKDERLFNFLNSYIPMRRIPDHEFLTYIERDHGFYNYPIHRDDINSMPDREKILEELGSLSGAESSRNLEEYWIRSVGPTLYGKFIEKYTEKMWKVESNREIDDFIFSVKGVTVKSGPRAAWTEAISAFPDKINGYDDYFAIATQKTKVYLNTIIEAYDMENYRVKIKEKWFKYDTIVSTTSPDILLNYTFGPLRWVGRDFFKIVLPIKEAFPKNVYFLYYANDEPFTRMVEYKKFYRYDSATTLLIMEIPTLRGDSRLYPYPIRRDQEVAQKYLDSLPKNIFSIGRAGSYRYIDIDDVILQCLNLAKRI